MSRLLSLITPTAVDKLNELMADPTGVKGLAVAHKRIARLAPQHQHAADVEQVANIIAASWPNLRLADDKKRKAAAESAAAAAVRRCAAAAVEDYGTAEIPTGDTVDLDIAASSYNGHRDPAPAPDHSLRTTPAELLTEALLGTRTHSPATVHAIARPTFTDERTHDRATNPAAILRTMEAPTKGRAGQKARAELADFLADLRESGNRVLAALAMTGPTATGPNRLRAPWTAEQAHTAAEQQDRPGGAWKTGQPVWHPKTDVAGKVTPTVHRRPGTRLTRPGYGPWDCAWLTLPDRSILIDAETADAVLAGSLGTTIARLAGPVRAERFLPDDSGEPARSLAAVPGVPGGMRSGPSGLPAGGGKPYRKQASRKRKRDGGIGSPMI
jgi:hypothetical protein